MPVFWSQLVDFDLHSFILILSSYSLHTITHPSLRYVIDDFELAIANEEQWVEEQTSTFTMDEQNSVEDEK